jgi:thymidine kinase|tara:strand:+ start:12189 stop:12752 length:564 start_codon:yes stop_codon:yes gene_type:complete
MIKEINNFGCIEVICGNMFSGKTEELIRRLRRAKIARLNVKIFKPKIDTRYEDGNIVSHNQLKLKSFVVESITEINDLVNDADVVGIDEAQFFDDTIINVVKDLSSKGKRVIIAGLDTDFKGVPFGPMPKLMCESDFLDKLQAICVKCGNPASYTQRISKDDKQVVIGETDIYEARCRHCYQHPEKK